MAVDKSTVLRHLAKLGIAAGSRLAVHSRLLSFGRIVGGAQTVYDTLREAVGETGTLVFPTYTTYLDEHTPYDPATTPSRGMGALSEFARLQSGVRRTLCPLHGHAVIGSDAEIILDADPSRSIGPQSSFEAMRKSGFELLLLGCSFQEGATYVHHVEAMTGVPYREWLTLKRQVVEAEGATREMECSYYGRRRELGLLNDLNACERAVIAREDTRTVQVPGGSRHSYLISLPELDACVMKLLRQDPYVFVSRPSGKIHAD